MKEERQVRAGDNIGSTTLETEVRLLLLLPEHGCCCCTETEERLIRPELALRCTDQSAKNPVIKCIFQGNTIVLA